MQACPVPWHYAMCLHALEVHCKTPVPEKPPKLQATGGNSEWSSSEKLCKPKRFALLGQCCSEWMVGWRV